MAPSIAEQDRAVQVSRLLTSLDLDQFCRLYSGLFPLDRRTPGMTGPVDEVRMRPRMVAHILMYRVSDEQIREILDRAPDSQPIPPGGSSFQAAADIEAGDMVVAGGVPGTVTTSGQHHRSPGAMLIPGRIRPTLELTDELWAALGRMLNPASLQEEFASAILRGDMDTARVLFDKLQDQGLSV